MGNDWWNRKKKYKYYVYLVNDGGAQWTVNDGTRADAQPFGNRAHVWIRIQRTFSHEGTQDININNNQIGMKLQSFDMEIICFSINFWLVRDGKVCVKTLREEILGEWSEWRKVRVHKYPGKSFTRNGYWLGGSLKTFFFIIYTGKIEIEYFWSSWQGRKKSLKLCVQSTQNVFYI